MPVDQQYESTITNLQMTGEGELEGNGGEEEVKIELKRGNLSSYTWLLKIKTLLS